MKYRYVFFDMDGTVLNTLDDLRDSVNHILAENGLKSISLEETARNLGNGAANLIRQAMIISSGTEPSDEIFHKALDAYKPYYREHSSIKTAPYPGILEAMSVLKENGVRMAIVSNKPDNTVQLLSDRYFGNLVETSIGESAEIKKKPAADTVFAAMDRMGISLSEREQCVYIGDTEVDIETAANSGMDCIAVTWGFRSRGQLLSAGATVIADSSEELLNMILE